MIYMNSKLQHFYDNLKGKPISFIGLGRTHQELLEQFSEKGAVVTLRDKRTRQQIGEETCCHLEKLGIKLMLGKNYLDNLDNAGTVLRTPGVYYSLPELNHARQNGTALTSELELFFDLCPCRIYGITGSDGKTTTTSIIAEFFRAEGRNVFLGGNIGKPLLPRIEQIDYKDIAVVELSSFQLMSMRCSPDVAIVTNVTPNHLDVHGNMEEYIDCKKNIYRHQNGFSRTIINADNNITFSFLPEIRGEVRTFSRQTPTHHGAYLGEDGWIYVADKNGVTKVLHKDKIRIPGIHNVENYLAAISAVWGEIPLETINKVAEEFPGVEHRIEFVREIDGVKWYNDSIASSPTRTIAGLNSFPQKIILIAGGYDKKIPFQPLAPKVIEKVKVLILMGDTAQQIQEAVQSCPDYNPETLPIHRVDTMEDAVRTAQQYALSGDIVSLSPACAAFDLYKDFEARGKHYKQLVLSL